MADDEFKLAKTEAPNIEPPVVEIIIDQILPPKKPFHTDKHLKAIGAQSETVSMGPIHDLPPEVLAQVRKLGKQLKVDLFNAGTKEVFSPGGKPSTEKENSTNELALRNKSVLEAGMLARLTMRQNSGEIDGSRGGRT